RAWRRRQGAERGLVAALLASLAAFYVQGLVGFTVVATGVLFAAEAACLCRLAAAGAEPAPEPAPPQGKLKREEGDSRGPHTGLAAIAGAVALLFVIGPLRAQRAAHEGAARTRNDPAAAVAAFRRAVELEPGRDAYWSKLGMAAQQAAQRAAAGEK